MANSFICGLLILLCLSALLGLFLSRQYVKKISCLSISYSSFVILIVFISLKNPHLNEVLPILVSVMIIFSVSLLMGIGIIKNITKVEAAND
jgi:hypothetical protein